MTGKPAGARPNREGKPREMNETEPQRECPRCGSIMCEGCYPAPVEYPGFELPLPEDDA